MSRFGIPRAALVAVTLVFACSSDDSDDGGGGAGNGGTSTSGGTSGGGGQMDAVTFTNDIYPILRMKCGGTGSSCHGDPDQAPYQPGHGSADVEEAYEATQENGVTGDPVYERILERITSTEPGGNMPPAPICQGGIGNPGCVTQAELDLIEEWIAQGTPQ